ncbi:hypothetical protein [Arthrobacter sp. OAP107]|uniref:prealbumin-like fold domain-containing protein n=1 Tax=Arthrobacter sp. OAP107 TaxID=3156445 RepID=UPI0033952A55
MQGSPAAQPATTPADAESAPEVAAPEVAAPQIAAPAAPAQDVAAPDAVATLPSTPDGANPADVPIADPAAEAAAAKRPEIGIGAAADPPPTADVQVESPAAGSSSAGTSGSASEGKGKREGENEHSTKKGAIIVTKKVEGVADRYEWSFDFILSRDHGKDGVSRTASGTGPGKDTVTFDGLDTGGTYTLQEGREDGWAGGDLDCDGVADKDSHAAGMQLAFPRHGEKIYCTVTNTARAGEVTLTKKVAGARADYKWSFPFTIEPSVHGDKATKYATSSDPRIHWDGLLAGQRYTITEKVPQGWTAGKIVCEAQGNGYGGRDKASTERAHASFTADAGDDIKCAVTNTLEKERKGRIVIVKTVDGDDATFHFTGSRVGGSSEAGKDFDIRTVEGKGRKVFNDVEPGKYSVAEKDFYPDYVAGTPSCTGSHKGEAWEGTSKHGVVIDLDRGETVTCTFENIQTAKVIIDKVTDPAKDPTKFDFHWSRDGRVVQEFTLTDRQEPEVFEGLSPYREWQITELERSGWNLDDLTCMQDGEDFDGADIRNATAVLDLGPGDVVTCTFSNQKKHDHEGSGGAVPQVPVVDIPEQPEQPESPEIVVEAPEQPEAEAETSELPLTGAQSTNLVWPSAALLLAGSGLVAAVRPRRRRQV